MGVGTDLRRLSGLPFIAGATDLVNAMPVQVTGPWTVLPVRGVTEGPPVGITRGSAAAGKAVDVRDRGNIVRVVAAATFASGELVGVASMATIAAGPTGTSVVQVPQYAPVTRASGSVRWSLGVSLEAANPGNTIAFLVEPQQISGLA
jgi:hypothetical protein